MNNASKNALFLSIALLLSSPIALMAETATVKTEATVTEAPKTEAKAEAPKATETKTVDTKVETKKENTAVQAAWYKRAAQYSADKTKQAGKCVSDTTKNAVNYVVSDWKAFPKDSLSSNVMLTAARLAVAGAFVAAGKVAYNKATKPAKPAKQSKPKLPKEAAATN